MGRFIIEASEDCIQDIIDKKRKGVVFALDSKNIGAVLDIVRIASEDTTLEVTVKQYDIIFKSKDGSISSSKNIPLEVIYGSCGYSSLDEFLDKTKETMGDVFVCIWLCWDDVKIVSTKVSVEIECIER